MEKWDNDDKKTKLWRGGGGEMDRSVINLRTRSFACGNSGKKKNHHKTKIF